MKKQLFIGAAALVAMAMTGCQKTGTIEGVVLDPFTGKAIEMPTVWMDSTIFGTQNPKYPYKADLHEFRSFCLRIEGGTVRDFLRFQSESFQFPL